MVNPVADPVLTLIEDEIKRLDVVLATLHADFDSAEAAMRDHQRQIQECEQKRAKLVAASATLVAKP